MKDFVALESSLISGDRRALSKWISAAENMDQDVWKLLSKHYGKLARSRVVGLTGPPGAGKSTILARLIERLRTDGHSVAVLAIDPVSPFSHGAILGDRLRLASHFNDEKVFIRSVSTRGRLGGLSLAAREVVHLMDLAGFDWVFVETVGVGQSEVDIRAIADLTLVILVPEAGDDIQTLKAGVLEIGDAFVVNKSDRALAEEMSRYLLEMVSLSKDKSANVFLTRFDKPDSYLPMLEWIQSKFNDKSYLKGLRSRHAMFDAKSLIESWVMQETRKWLSKARFENGNPYEAAIRFSQTWTLPEVKS